MKRLIKYIFLITCLQLLLGNFASSQVKPPPVLELELVDKDKDVGIHHWEIRHESLKGVWVNPDGTQGWAVGEKGRILRYDETEGKEWKSDEQAGKLTDKWLTALWMKSDGTYGWAVGEKGVILRYVKNEGWKRDEKASNVTGKNLTSLWMNADGTKGGAAGVEVEIQSLDPWAKDNDNVPEARRVVEVEILSYQKEQWQRDEQNVEITNKLLTSLRMNEEYTEDLDAGTQGEILFYDGQRRRQHKQACKVSQNYLTSLWMKVDGTIGWAVGVKGEILHYEKNIGWEIKHKAGDLTGQQLNSICMNADGTKGWAVGKLGEILSYDKGRWQRDNRYGKASDNELKSLWMKADGTQGWAVGEGGVILRYEKNKGWKIEHKAREVTDKSKSLNSLWMTADGTQGWAVGEDGEILQYEDDKWKKLRRHEQADKIPKKILYSLWMKEDGTQGWAVGEEGEILQYEENKWKKLKRYEQDGNIPKKTLYSLWMNAGGTEGWVVGENGEILRYENKKWKVKHEAGDVSKKKLTSIWMNSDGSRGWAVGAEGEILSYEKNIGWKIKHKAGDLTGQQLNSICMNADGTKGWVVGNQRRFLFYTGQSWQIDTQLGIKEDEKLNSLWVNENGTEGWAIGGASDRHGVIIPYSPKKIDNPTLICGSEDGLENLGGTFTLKANNNITEIVSIHIVRQKDSSGRPLTKKIEKTNIPERGSKTIKFSFKDIDEIKNDFGGSECYFKIKLKYYHPSLPVNAVYRTKDTFKIFVLPSRLSFWGIWKPVILSIFIALIIIIAIYIIRGKRKPPIEPEETVKPKVFISYSRRNKKFVNRLSSDLRDAGMEVWVYEKKIYGGQYISKRVEKGISWCEIFCLIISRHSIKSEWVEREFRTALNMQLSSGGIPLIIPIKIQNVELPIFLKDIMYVDFTGSYKEGFRQLLDAINAEPD